MLDPELTGHDQVFRCLLTKYLKCALNPRSRRHGGAGAAAQVRVVEVRQPVGCSAHGPPDPALLPGQHAVVGAEPGQHRADRVTVTDHDPVDAANVTCFRADPQPAGGTHHRKRGFRARAGQLERHRPSRLGQRAMSQEGTAPRRLAITGAAGDDLPGQPAYRPAPRVHQAGLPGQALAVLNHPDDVPVALAQPAGGKHDQLRRVPEDLADVLAQPARGCTGVEFGLDHDVSVVQVQAPGEPQQRRHLSFPAAWLEHADPAELVLDQAGQGHQSHSPSNIRANAPASRRGSCRSGRPAIARSASTSRPPSWSAAFSSSRVVPFVPGPSTAQRSASTTSNARSGAWLASTSRCACGENPSVSPGCGARFSVTSLRADVATRAPASSGTSKCGSTLVNHEPGPSTTQSASATACTASAHTGGSAGTNDIDRTRPVVFAQATWPRTVLIRRGNFGSIPSTSACSSSGTDDIGSTRPCAPSSRPTQSRPCTVSPSNSQSAMISRLPPACPPSSPFPVNLCCTTLLQVVPQESSPQSAASAIRRSPGGSTPYSRLSLPLEPPSSATVTMAVRSRVTRRSAESDA